MTYAAGGGSGTAPAAETYAEGAEVTIKANPFTAPEGKEFNGWSDGSKTYKAGDKLTMPGANVTLTAQWKTSEQPVTEYWTVTFKNGETVEKTVQVVKGQKLTAEQIPAAPTVEDGKEFKGWFNGETQITVDTVISGNITAIAKIDNKPAPTHTCGHVCTVEGCGKCTDATCTDPVCANNRCPGHEPAHECGHVCAICGKCTTDCANAACSSKCSKHEPFTSFWVPTDTAEMLPYADGNLISIKLKSSLTSFSGTVSYAADSDHAFIAIKYSGNATLHEISIYGTKAGGEVKSGVVAAISTPGWNVTKTVGTDFSVVVAQIGGYYGVSELDIDTVTNIGFTVSGEADQTITIHGVEVLPNANHNLGTPTPEEGDLEIGDLTVNNTAFTVSKAENDQTVSFSAAPGYNCVEAAVTHLSSDMKFLYLNMTLSDTINLGVYANATSLYEHVKVLSGDQAIAIPVSGLPNSFSLKFYFNAANNPGAEYSDGNPKTVVFHEISFKETDPTVSADPNHFRTPVGMAGVNYSESDKKITYTNTNTDYYRYLEILLDNHDVAYDILVLNITGYNGLRLGVRALYNDEVEGEVTTATSDLIYSGSYYSEIKTDEATEIILYLGANGLKGKVVTGIQLYLDVLANAGKEGEVELTLNDISLLKSADLSLADTTIEAQDATIAAGGTPDFQAVLKSGGNTIDGTIITEYRLAGSTGNYDAGIPTAAGTYEVRFYYMGSREYNYSRTTTVTLTVTEA